MRFPAAAPTRTAWAVKSRRKCSSPSRDVWARTAQENYSLVWRSERSILKGDTIIGVHESHPSLRSLIQGAPEAEDHSLEGEVSRLFKIRSADSHGQRSSASVLVNRMYAARGYLSTAIPNPPMPTRITFTATEHDETIGTITIGFDSDTGLHVDELFACETETIRRQGRRVCEFTKLAMDSVVKSKRVLASLFHVSYIFAHRIMGYDDLVIEVNPRHVRYYERMLGFEALGAPRHNHRVNAPAVLMRLQFSHAHAEIGRCGGSPEYALVERSLYPYFFSVSEEASIVGRLDRSQSNVTGWLDAAESLPMLRGVHGADTRHH